MVVRGRVAVLAALAIAMTAMGLGVASAAPGPPLPSGQLRWMTCPLGQPAGRIDSLTAMPTPHWWGFQLHANLDVRPCHPVPPCAEECLYTDVYGVGVFYPSGAPGSAIARYVDLPADGRKTLGFAALPGAQAVCLFTDNGRRADCVALSWPDPAGPPVIGGHIPVDDPLVFSSYLQLPLVKLGPGCPVCWD